MGHDEVVLESNLVFPSRHLTCFEIKFGMAMCTHCLSRYKGAPLYLTRQCLHVAFVLGLVIVNRYSISLTLVCDFNNKFTSYLAGYPGSCHNSYVLSNIKIAHQPEKFFD
ncbi:hypothetical protein VP01_6083g1 [Puccinia sorghi]|uniref:Uncharacterized protein n=1 Tax=Puccinia sorghi TaxID=27349 RepID=A0A0L6UHZ7_9BASI|nr:hypothetical protein VP01_6083g1 [Puccinia sorghi]